MSLDLATAIRIFEVLLGWSLLLQTLEYLKLVRMDRVGDWEIQRQEIPNQPVRWLLDRLFEACSMKVILFYAS